MGAAYSCRLGPTTFHIAEGDLFEVDADAIVNSEQTDFILAENPESISGQILHRYGYDVQSALDAQTDQEVLPRASVLLTRAGRAIYHAGFHEPHEWLDSQGEDNQTEYVSSVRSCVRQILSRLAADDLRSVAFPVLGTGLFGLSPELLLREFMEELVAGVMSGRLSNGAKVSLIVRRSQDYQTAVECLTQALADSAFPHQIELSLKMGVPYLDRFYATRVHSYHPNWFAWMLCRHTELVSSFPPQKSDLLGIPR